MTDSRTFNRLPGSRVVPLALVCLYAALYCGQADGSAATLPDGIQATDPRLKMTNEGMTFQGRPFTGTLLATPLQRVIPYVDGQIHGTERVWYPDGRLAAERRYEHGKKVGTHRHWWPNGKLNFYQQFVDGLPHGEFWGWSNTGQLVEYARYERGEELGRKKWRGNGRIYANYVYTQEQLLGLAGGRLCYKIEAGRAAENPIEYK